MALIVVHKRMFRTNTSLWYSKFFIAFRSVYWIRRRQLDRTRCWGLGRLEVQPLQPVMRILFRWRRFCLLHVQGESVRWQSKILRNLEGHLKFHWDDRQIKCYIDLQKVQARWLWAKCLSEYSRRRQGTDGAREYNGCSSGEKLWKTEYVQSAWQITCRNSFIMLMEVLWLPQKSEICCCCWISSTIRFC